MWYNIYFKPEILSTLSEEDLFNLGASCVNRIIGDDAHDSVLIISEDPEPFKDRFMQQILSIESIDDNSWKYNWMDSYHEFNLLEDIIVRPFNSDAVKPCIEKNVILLDPRDAFGDGRHPTTRCCSLLIKDLIKSDPVTDLSKIEFIDIGTGTGILAILAYMYGIKNLSACDIEDDSIKRAFNNFKINNLEPVRLFKYDITKGPLDHKYDIITANLLTDILMRSLKHIKRSLKEGCFAILSGVSDKWEDDIIHSIKKEGFALINRVKEDKWNGFLIQNKINL